MRLDTPVGEISFQGALTPKTMITMPSGVQITLARWATLTNGECFEWLDEAQSQLAFKASLVKHLPGRHDQQSHAGGRGGASTIRVSGERNWSEKDEADAEAAYTEKYESGTPPDRRPDYVGYYAGDGYQTINPKLRGQDYRETIFSSEELDTQIEGIDRAIANSPDLVGDKNLYRIYDNDLLDRLEEGDTVVDAGFLSTTRVDITAPENRALRDGLGKISPSKDTVAVILPNPKGKGKGLLVDKYLKKNKQPTTPITDREKEVLLPRDTSLTFLGFQEKGEERIALFERAD